MNKIYIAIMAAMLIIVAAVYAHGNYEKTTENINYEMMEHGMMGQGMMAMHQNHMGENHMGEGMHEYMEEFHEILEEGTYNDLVAFREEIGVDIKPFINSEETFEAMKEHHNEMMESGMMGQMSGSGMSGCPMHR